MKSLPDRVAGDVDEVALLEDILDDEPLPRLEAVDGLEAELLEVAHGDGTGLLQVAELGFGELAVADAAVTDLHGVVAVSGRGLDLADDVALAESNDGDGDNGSIGLEVCHHPELSTHHTDARLHAHDRYPTAAPLGEDVHRGGERAERTRRGGRGAQGEEGGAGEEGGCGSPSGSGREGRAARAAHQRHLHLSSSFAGRCASFPCLCLISLSVTGTQPRAKRV